MTLLVAVASNEGVWMIADTAVTGGTLGTRDRENGLKVWAGGECMFGFAGDFHSGQVAVREARQAGGCLEIKERLVGISGSRAVDFAYAERIDGEFALYKITAGTIERVAALHLGSRDAFEVFQTARHNLKAHHPPDAVDMLFVATRGSEPVPTAVPDAILAMFKTFASHRERDVGGVPIALHLPTIGSVEPIMYLYAASDPIVPQLRTGDPVPPGSAERGGYSLSVSTAADGDGFVAYSPQRQRGEVYLFGSEALTFDGDEAAFAARVVEELGWQPEIWTRTSSEEGPPDSIEIVADDQGVDRLAIARRGRSFSYSWISGGPESWKSDIALKIYDSPPPKEFIGTVVSATVTTGAAEAEIQIQRDAPLKFNLTSEEVDHLIKALAAIRVRMNPIVPTHGPAETYPAFDPVWRTRPTPHPSMGPGVVLSLRHGGYGWIDYVLPPHEQRTLGRWLVEDHDARFADDEPKAG